MWQVDEGGNGKGKAIGKKDEKEGGKETSLFCEGRQIPPVKTEDLPATQGSIWHLQKQMQTAFKSFDKKLAAHSNEVGARFSEMEARFDKIDARFNQIEARLDKMESLFEKLAADMHRMMILMEEQNARNKFVLDGYESLYQRQDGLEK